MNGAIKAGHDVEKVVLNDNLQGCKGCGACQLNGHKCIIQDSMQDLYKKFDEADTIVFASPLYFWSISSRMKCFIDRLYAISTDDKYPYKETILLMSSGDNKFYTFHQALSFYSFYTNALGWKNLGVVLAGGCKGSAHQRFIDEKYLNEAYQLGLKI